MNSNEKDLLAAGSFSSHPSPAPSPERAIYGFALFLSSVIAALVYLIWAFVPPKYLAEIGIDFLPNQYWAIVVPLCICALVFFIPLCYGFICLRMMPDTGIEHIAVDEFSRTSVYHRLTDTPEGGIPPLCDIPLEFLEKYSKILAIILPLLVFGVGIWDVFLNFEANFCQMTYMFEYPNYVPVPLNDSVTDSFPKYGLYVYGEGARTVEYERGIFAGTPVLFIPGNAGSYRQARSLGSVLLRMAEKRQNTLKFDVFTIDFDEELAGLYGGYLSSQTDFVLHCMQQIASLYGKSVIPTKIVLVGHSVGGIIARGLFLNPGFDPTTVNTIFTLSTPHHPILLVDPELEEFYHDITEYWMKSANTTLQDVVMVSFAGGHRDVLVRSDRSGLTGVFSRHNDRFISMTTTSIPNVWASTDHLCIVWCKQLVIAMGRALFDMVDVKSKRQLVDLDRRKTVIRKYFLNAGSDAKLVGHGETVVGEKNCVTTFNRPGPFRLVTRKYQPASYYVFPLQSTASDVAVISNGWSNQWIDICFDLACNDTQTLSTSPKRFPWFSEDPNFYAVISRDTLAKVLFLRLLVAKRGDVTTLQVEETLPVSNLAVITFTDAVFRSPNFALSNKAYYRVKVSLTELWESLTVIVTVSGETCTTNRGVLRFAVPGFIQDTYKRMDGPVNAFSLKLQAVLPFDSESSTLELFINPACSYDVTFRVAWADLAGQLIRFYVVQLPAFFAAVVVIQLVALYRERKCGIWDHFLVNLLAGSIAVGSRYLPDLLRRETLFVGASEPAAFVFWVIFYSIAYSVISLFEIVLHVVVSIYSYPVHFIAKPFVLRLQGLQSRTSFRSYKIFIFPLFTVAMIVFAYVTCGENAIILSLLLYFVKVCYKTRNHTLSGQSTTSSDITESTKLLLLAVLVTTVNVIPAIVWSKRFPTSLIDPFKSSYGRLDPDPSFGVSLVAGLVLDFALREQTSGYDFLRRTSGTLDLFMQLIIYGTSAAVLVYGQEVFYMINFLLSLFLTVLACDFVRKIFTDHKPLRG